jgi:hypothetical protein
LEARILAAARMTSKITAAIFDVIFSF